MAVCISKKQKFRHLWSTTKSTPRSRQPTW